MRAEETRDAIYRLSERERPVVESKLIVLELSNAAQLAIPAG